MGDGEPLYVLFASMTAKGDEYIIPNPTFPNHASQLHLHGGVPKFVGLEDDFHLNASTIEYVVTDRTKAIGLFTPNNPTGAVYTRKELRDVLEIAERHDLLIISDENYSQLVYDNNLHVSIGHLPGAMERTIVVNGLSKAYGMTGWRLGYLLARKDLVE